MFPRAEQPPHLAERSRSFDQLASVDLYAYDLENFGYILPETDQRVSDEELTLIAEGLNRPLPTTFILHESNGSLQHFDHGQWIPYQVTLTRGLEIAEADARLDPRKRFLADRAATDWMIGQTLNNLQPGELYSWCSPFPDEELAKFGPDFIGEQGFQVARRMGFLYHAEKLTTGEIVLKTQSVDNSDKEAFVAALDAGGNITQMLEAYDKVLGLKNGANYRAGRLWNQKIAEENAWEVIHRHLDLIDYYKEQIKNLAALRLFTSRYDLERDKRRLTYSVWAAIKQRIDKTTPGHQQGQPIQDLYPDFAHIEQEIRHAYQELSRQGEVLFGCGGAIRGEDALLNADPSNVFDAVFGSNGLDMDKFGPLTFTCRKGHTNRRPRNKLIDECRVCHESVICDDKMKPSKGKRNHHGSNRRNLSRAGQRAIAGILLR